jgi:tetratricopeptide (TPR) repeat protein
LRELDAAEHAAASPQAEPGLALRVASWRAELAYFQGRYSEADDIVDRLVDPLERAGDWAYAAFALRIRIAVLLAHTDYAAAAALADRAIRLAEASGDDYVTVQILNILGAVSFDRATSKLDGPHARAHLSALDPRDTAPDGDRCARSARPLRARPRPWPSARITSSRRGTSPGNIERLEILLGNAAHAVRNDQESASRSCRRAARTTTRSSLDRISPGGCGRWAATAKR